MNRFEKQSSETFNISIDFNDVLEAGETITIKEVTAYLGSTDKTTDVITSSKIDSSGKKVIIKVKDGKNKRTYQITVKITTSESNIFEEDISMDVWNV